MRRIVISGLAVAAVSLTACGGGAAAPGATLRVPGYSGGSVGAKIGAVPNGQPYIMSIGNLCTDGLPIKITSVTATNVNGRMRVFDWGIRQVGVGFDTGPAHNWANHVGYLRKVMPSFKHRLVIMRCGHKYSGATQLDINVRKSTDLAVARNFVIHYADGRTLTMPFMLIICSQRCDHVPWPVSS